MMLISNEYRALNALKHRESDEFGANGHLWAGEIIKLAKHCGAASILDYGCGKSSLKHALALANGPAVHEYDPGIPGKFDRRLADLVVCTDVLEHVEPECIEAVLDDLWRCTGKYAFLTVATGPAMKHLADGRNAHATIEPAKWWLPKIMARWTLVSFNHADKGFIAVVRA